jgi:peptidyl-prolyl cis-trans isomerase SurA
MRAPEMPLVARRPSVSVAAALLALLAVAAVPAGAGARTVDRVVARVAGEAVTSRQVDSALAREPGLSREKALRLLVERLLVQQWAKKHNIAVSDKEVESALGGVMEQNRLTAETLPDALAVQGYTPASFRAEIRDSLLVTRATLAALEDRIAVSDEEVAARWQKDYPPVPTFRLKHIFFSAPAQDAPSGVPSGVREEKARQASQLLDRIRAGSISFADAVRQYSEDAATREAGGDLGTFSPGELFPEMEKAADALAAGEVAGPVQGPDGIHLVQLVSRNAAPAQPLEAVKAGLAGLIREEKGKSAREAWIRELEKESAVEVFPDTAP